jgi:hypothetical protein
VRWSAQLDADLGDGSRALATTQLGPLDPPAAHVARLESPDGFWHRLHVANVDGTAVDASPAKPVALAPGPRWVELRLIDHTWRPPRDFNVAYAFRLPAVAGHVYRPDTPARCLAPGPVDAVLESHLVRHTTVTLTDRAPGQAPQRLTLPALCTAGTTAECETSEQSGSADGLACVALEGSARGLHGRNELPAQALAVAKTSR